MFTIKQLTIHDLAFVIRIRLNKLNRCVFPISHDMYAVGNFKRLLNVSFRAKEKYVSVDLMQWTG